MTDRFYWDSIEIEDDLDEEDLDWTGDGDDVEKWNEGDHKRGKGGRFEYAGGRKRDKEREKRRQAKADDEKKAVEKPAAKPKSKAKAEPTAKPKKVPKAKAQVAKYRDLGGDGNEIHAQRYEVTQRESKAWKSKLSKTEKATVIEYSEAGIDDPTNGYLRYFETNGNTDELNDRVDLMDAAIAKAGPSTTDMIVYRGMSKKPRGLKVGKAFRDEGYASTSLDRKVAEGFLDKKSGVLMHVAVPKGSKGGFLGSMSAYGGEYEFLLGRGSKFHVDKIEVDKDGFTHAYVHLTEQR